MSEKVWIDSPVYQTKDSELNIDMVEPRALCKLYMLHIEVLAALDIVNMNLNIPEDAEIFLAFLSTPSGQFESGYALLQRWLNSIDYDLRRKTLRDKPLYAPFLSTNER